MSAESRRPRPGAGGNPAYNEPLSDSELRLEAALLRVLQSSNSWALRRGACTVMELLADLHGILADVLGYETKHGD